MSIPPSNAERRRVNLALAAAALLPLFLPSRSAAAWAACGTACSPADIEALAPAQCRQMAYIPEGEFVYGDSYQAAGKPVPPAYSPRPVVRLRGEAFWLDKCEVTIAQYGAYYDTMTRKRNGWPTGERADVPATSPITHKLAAAYCAYLGKRLPTDKEWEMAARGGTSTIYPWGDDWPGAAEEFVQAEQSAWAGPVAQKKPNQYGLFDMIGNAAERTESPEVTVGGNLNAPLSNSLSAYLYSPGYRHIRYRHPALGWRCAKSAEKKEETGRAKRK